MRDAVYLVAMFVDRIKVVAKAGDGGRGCVSFRREKFVPRGGPDGGDGGRGGDVILRADEHTDNLAGLFYEPLIKAKNGAHGMGKQMHGRGAAAKIVKVPVGTVVHRMDSLGDPSTFADSTIGDSNGNRRSCPRWHSSKSRIWLCLTKSLFSVTVAKAEKAMFISRARATARHASTRRERKARKGLSFSSCGRSPMPDWSVIRTPGKSTLLRRISAAHPKVAPYPFTTLHPMIGVVDFDDYRRATVADIPGLIEGAHRNLGLGHAFLRHITRCRLLLFVLDMAGSEGRNPIEDLQHLRREIDLYDPRLAQRPWRVVANKMDLPEADENLAAFRRRFPDREVVPVSAKEKEGIEESERVLWIGGC